MSTKGEIEAADDLMDDQGANSVPSVAAWGMGGMTHEPVFLKVVVMAKASDVLVAFDPVSVEETQKTRELNKFVRLGFVPPVTSTR